MVDTVFREANLDDALNLFANLRTADRVECMAYGEPVFNVIAESMADSFKCWAAMFDGELAAVFGVTPIDDDTGAPWMLGTPVLDRHQRILVRQAPRYIAEMRETFPHLLNYVHAKNTTSVGWLRRIGFTIHPAVPYGAPGEMFHPFEMLP